MRYVLVVLLGLLCLATPAAAQVSIGIGLPGVNIGINMGSYPELVAVPDYPVYYAPRGDVNLFFYDGMYWAYQGDNWYASSWYNGPWGLVGPEFVPAFVLRIPVRYYRHPPSAWAGWQRDAPPRWGERWGNDWAQHRKGWDQWDRHAVQARAPLPVYQRQYSGNRYPQEAQQQALLRDKYRYQPKEPVVREHYQQHGALAQPAERKQQANQRSSPPPPPRQSAPAVSRAQQPQGGGEGVPRSAPPAPLAPRQGGPAVERQKQQPQPAVVQHEQPAPKLIQHEQPAPKPQGQQDRPQPKVQGKAEAQHQQQGQERGQEQEKGPERNK